MVQRRSRADLRKMHAFPDDRARFLTGTTDGGLRDPNGCAKRALERRTAPAAVIRREGRYGCSMPWHKDGNPQNNAPENLEALCKNCHCLTHALLKPLPPPTLSDWHSAA
jgi:hypothetical protein